MTQDSIYNNLLAKRYPEKAASILAEDLFRISTVLEPCLHSWMESGEEADYSVEGFSIKGLMQKYQLQYPAALLSIDWVIKDPVTAIAAINRGIR
jgi:hypothetical protein